MLDPLLYRWGVPLVVIRCLHWTMQMWVLQTWIIAQGLAIVMYGMFLFIIYFVITAPHFTFQFTCIGKLCSKLNKHHQWTLKQWSKMTNYHSVCSNKMATFKHLNLDDVFPPPEACQCIYGIAGLVQERCNSRAIAMELHFSCTNPLIYESELGHNRLVK